jgi:hypothetical protein
MAARAAVQASVQGIWVIVVAIAVIVALRPADVLYADIVEIILLAAAIVIAVAIGVPHAKLFCLALGHLLIAEMIVV